jgi:hypothetical protein
MQKRWYYCYVIVYPSLGYKFYYGSRITKNAPADDHDYFGSSVTFSHYNDPEHAEYQADALKIILWAAHLPRAKKHALALGALEAANIRAALDNREHLGPDICLNRNYGGRIVLTPAEYKAAAEKSRQAGSGFAGMSKKAHKKWATLGGHLSKLHGKGVHGLSQEERRRNSVIGGGVVRDKYAKDYTFCDPDGELVAIRNLKAFCRERNLNPGHMRSVNCGRIKSHKGWRKPAE